MTSLVRSTGFTGASGSSLSRPTYAKKTILKASNGNAIMVIADPNISTATYGAQDNVGRIYIYESSDRISWTLRATVVAGVQFFDYSHPQIYTVRWSAEIFSNNDIGIVYTAFPASGFNSVRYVKVTYATWAAAAEEVVYTESGSTGWIPHAVDITVTDADVPVVGISNVLNSSGSPLMQVIALTRRTATPAWITTMSVDTLASGSSGGSNSIRNQDISVTAVKGVGTATARQIIVASQQGIASTGDQGSKVWTVAVNESTGVGSSATLRVTLGAGDLDAGVGTSGSGTTESPRKVSVFCAATGLVTVASYGKRYNSTTGKYDLVIRIMQFTWDGTTYTVTVQPTTFVPTLPASLTAENGLACTVGYRSATNVLLNFYISSPYLTANGDITGYLVNYSADINIAASTVTLYGPYKFNGNSTAGITEAHPFGNSDKNMGMKNDVMFMLVPSAGGNLGYQAYHAYLENFPAPTTVTPAASSTIISANPPVSAVIALAKKYAQTGVKLVWQMATDSGFTTNLRTYTQADSKFITANGTDAPGGGIAVSDTFTVPPGLSQTTWYVRARLESVLGGTFALSAGQSFTVAHAPSASGLSPAGSVYLLYDPSGVTFTWTFSDPSSTDHQTAFEVICERTSDGVVVFDSGKVTSTNSVYVGTIATTYKETALRWKVRVWDIDDVAGAYSSYANFYVVDPPTVTITSPTAAQVLTTGVPTFTANAIIGATRTLKSYQFSVLQGSTTVYDSGLITSAPGLTGTVAIANTPSTPVLINNQSYTLRVQVTDNTGLINSSTVSFTTQWIPPAPPQGITVDASQFNVEGAGYISVSWADTNRDVDIQYWIIYRRADEINPGTQTVLSVGDWKEVARIYDLNTAGYTAKDYYAPSGGRITYRVTQVVNRFGSIIESDDRISNQFVNPSFETSATTGWTMVNGTLTGPIPGNALAELDDPDYATANFARIVATGAGLTSATPSGTLPAPNLNRAKTYPGETVFVRARVRNDSTVNGAASVSIGWRIGISFYDSTGTIIGTETQTATTTTTNGTIAVISQTITAPANAYSYVAKIYMGTTTMTALLVNVTGAIDSVMGTEQAVTTYFDGGYPLSAWVSTPTLSPAYKQYEYDKTAIVFPVSQGYWLISPDDPSSTGTAIRLQFVTADSFSDEYEEEEFTIVGRGRHVDRGEKLGVKGTLTVQLRDLFNGGASARQQKQKIMAIKDDNRSLYLRNPFGDVYQVAVGNLAIGRIAGVGTSEFVDVEVPYSEVGD